MMKCYSYLQIATCNAQILETLLGGNDLSEQQTQAAMEVWLLASRLRSFLNTSESYSI